MSVSKSQPVSICPITSTDPAPLLEVKEKKMLSPVAANVRQISLIVSMAFPVRPLQKFSFFNSTELNKLKQKKKKKNIFTYSPRTLPGPLLCVSAGDTSSSARATPRGNGSKCLGWFQKFFTEEEHEPNLFSDFFLF